LRIACRLSSDDEGPGRTDRVPGSCSRARLEAGGRSPEGRIQTNGRLATGNRQLQTRLGIACFRSAGRQSPVLTGRVNPRFRRHALAQRADLRSGTENDPAQRARAEHPSDVTIRRLLLPGRDDPPKGPTSKPPATAARVSGTASAVSRGGGSQWQRTR
jgi:hypothetical protein